MWGVGAPRVGWAVVNADESTELKALEATMDSIEAVLDVERLKTTIAELSEQASVPDLWSDQ